jgi:hypothetical protein
VGAPDAMLALLTDQSYFPHVLAVLLVATWALAMVTRPTGFFQQRARGLVIVLLAVAPYLNPGFGLALLALGVLVVCANLDQRWLSWAPERRLRTSDPEPGGPTGRTAGVASGVLYLLGGIGLMLLSDGGSAAWTWWIGLGTAGHGALIVITRIRGLRDFGPWG